MKRIGRVKESLLSLGSHLSSDQTGYVSPWRLFIIIIASIFIAEIVAMILVYFLEPVPYYLITLIDAGIMVVLICPILYLFSFRPLIQYVESLRQSEQKVELERRRLQSILDAMPYGIYIVNQQYDVEYVNPVIEREFGLVAGQKCYSYLHGEKDVCAWCKNPIIFGGKSTRWEWSSPTTGKTYEAFDTPLASSDGTLSKLKIIHDITERKRSEETVRMLSSVIEQTADTVVVTDCEGVIQYVNPAFEQLTGYQKEEAIGRTPRVLKSDIHDRQFYKILWETVLSGQVFHGEMANRKKNGDIFHEVKTITPLRNEQGEIIRFVATGKDITEHKLAEHKLYTAHAELEMRIEERTLELRYANSELEEEIVERKKAEQVIRENEEKYRSLFNSMTEGFALHEILCDHAGVPCDYRFLELNPSFERLTGLERDNLIGRTVKEVLPDLENTWIEKYGSVALTGEPIHFVDYTVTTRKWYEIYCYSPRRNQFAVLFFDITERKQAEAQLQYQATLLSNVNDAITASDAEFHLTAWNAGAEALYGWKADEVLGRNGLEIIRTLWPEVNAEEMRRTINETGHWRGEATQVRKDGTRFPVEVSSIVLHDNNGQIIGYASVNRDITERKRAEEALHQSQLDLSRAQEVGQIGSWRLDVRKNELTWSDENHRIFGIPKGTPMTYETFLSTIHPEDRPYVETKWTAALNGEPYDIEHRIIVDGVTKWVREKAYLEFDQKNALQGGFGISQDISERKRAEELLERSNQKLSEILASIQDDFYVLDRNWNFVYASRSFTEKVGKEPEDFVGTNIWTMFPKHVGTILEENFRAAMEKREVRRFELGGKYANAWHRMTVFPSADGITVIGTDITKRKRAEEALRESEAKYRDLFENMSEEVHFWQLVRDEAGHIKTWRLVDANPPTLRTWGRANIDEIRGKTTDEIFGPGATDHYMPVVQKIMTEGTSHSYEDYFPNLDKYFRFTTVPLADHFITTGADITSIKKAEQALRVAHDELELRVRERTVELAAANMELSNEIAERREIERQLRIQTAAMDAAANGIIITDPKGVMLWTNPAMAQISGYSEDELIGHNTRLFNSGKHEADFYNQMWGTILAGNVWRGETTNRRKDGSVYIEEQTITPVRNESGELSHFIAIKQDVTERKLIYAQLEASNQELITLTDSERQQRFLAEGLVESSAVLNMSLELHAVLDRIFEQTRRIIPYVTADIVLIDDHVATIVRQWWTEEYADARTISENDSLKIHEFPIWERICATESAVMVSDTQLEEQWNTYFGMTWICSYLGSPLIYNGQIIGIINLISDQADAFQQDMVKTLQAFAAPAAVAIQNARLYENEQKNRKIAEILSAASVALAQTLDTQMVMETILDYVQFVMPLDVVFVVMNEGDERYSIRAVRTGDDDTSLRDSLQDQTIDMLSEPIVRSYFAKHESTFIPDSRELSPWKPPPELAFLNCWLGIPLESMGKLLGLVVVAHTTPNIFTRDQIQLAEAVIKQAVVALQNAWLFEQVRSGRERLQQLSRHLVEIQENERKYIARELHDETSQSLTSLKMGLQVIEKEADRRVRLTEQVRNLQALADETLESLHHLAVNLRPASLDHLGLVDALTSLIASTKQRSGLQTHIKIIGSMPAASLTEEMETSIYRIVQESITNVIRHAQATYVDVILEWQNEKILIVIEDDGVGIDMQKARETGHLGLIGMQERAEMLGGKLVVDSAPQVGTTLVVEIPYANSNPYSR